MNSILLSLRSVFWTIVLLPLFTVESAAAQAAQVSSQQRPAVSGSQVEVIFAQCAGNIEQIQDLLGQLQALFKDLKSLWENRPQDEKKLSRWGGNVSSVNGKINSIVDRIDQQNKKSDACLARLDMRVSDKFSQGNRQKVKKLE